MELHFIDRITYKDNKKAFEEINRQQPDAYFIEEGGSNPLGVKGAEEIISIDDIHSYSHICCATGTGTMMAGLVNASANHQQVIGISALKLPPGNSVEAFIDASTGNSKNYIVHYDYHFGGYARKTSHLIDFMNMFYSQTGIPTDFVYTAKLFYALTDLAANDHFAPGSRLLVIHSGGLQGNRSLTKNTLVF